MNNKSADRKGNITITMFIFMLNSSSATTAWKVKLSHKMNESPHNQYIKTKSVKAPSDLKLKTAISRFVFQIFPVNKLRWFVSSAGHRQFCLYDDVIKMASYMRPKLLSQHFCLRLFGPSSPSSPERGPTELSNGVGCNVSKNFVFEVELWHLNWGQNDSHATKQKEIWGR